MECIEVLTMSGFWKGEEGREGEGLNVEGGLRIILYFCFYKYMSCLMLHRMPHHHSLQLEFSCHLYKEKNQAILLINRPHSKKMMEVLRRGHNSKL